MNKIKHHTKNINGQDILDAMPQVAYVFNKEQKLVMWNKNTEKVLGYSAQELYLKDIYDFVEETTIDINSIAIDTVFSEKKQQTIEQNLVTKSGKKIPILDSANYAMVNGEDYLIGLAIDISELKQTEKILKDVVTELQHLKNELQAENIFFKEERRSFIDLESTIIGSSQAILEIEDKIEDVRPLQKVANKFTSYFLSYFSII